MKKILAIILAALMCLSMTACGGGSDFNFVDEWVIVSNVDVTLHAEDNYSETKTVTYDTAMIIDKDYNLNFKVDGVDYAISGKDFRSERYEPNTMKLKDGYEREVYTEKFGYGEETYKCYMVGENVMVIIFGANKGTREGYFGNWFASQTEFVVVRKSVSENYANLSKIYSSDDSGFEVSLDGIVGEYNNTTFGYSSFGGKALFSTYENKNGLTIAKDGDKYTFTDGEGVKYTVENVGLSTECKGGISIQLSDGSNSHEIIVMETGESTITYCKGKSSNFGNFCVLEKK